MAGGTHRGKEVRGNNMGDVAEDMLNGECCSHCGIYFKEAHGHPVLCRDCYTQETKAERAGLRKAMIREV